MASSIAAPGDRRRPDRPRRAITQPIKPNTSEDDDSKQTSVDKTGGILCSVCATIFTRKKLFDAHYKGHKTGEEEIVYTCVACKKQVPGYIKFLSHCYLSHVVKNKFQCKSCQKQFSKLAALNSHVSLMHDFECNYCFQKFSCKRELETHKKIVHIKTEKGKHAPPYDCHMCNATIDTLDNCELHVDQHCQINYPCPICQELLLDKDPAIEHLTKHYVQMEHVEPTAENSREDSSIDVLGGIVCCHCDMIFRCRADIDSHFEVDHADKTVSYTCNVCNISFDKYYIFGAHCYNHYSKDRFQCDQCCKTFPRLSLLVMHMEMFHVRDEDDQREKPFSCSECGRGFYTCLRLHEHRRLVHEDEATSYRCTRPACNQAFGKPKELIAHMKVHSSWLESWCRQCGLQLPSLRSAARHLAVHRVARYACPVCPRHYRERYLLLKHVAVHFQAVYHVCTVCGKAYALRSRLIEHAKIHSRPRPHACSVCPKTFLTRSALAQHANVHAGTRPYACPTCPNKTFTSYPNWQKHLRRTHNLDAAAIRALRESLHPEPQSSHHGDLSPFNDSDDSSHGIKEEDASLGAPPARSIGDTVRSCIDALDHNLDKIMSNVDFTYPETPSEFNVSDPADGSNYLHSIEEHISQPGTDFNKSETVTDDSSDIAAIVEHIEEMEAERDEPIMRMEHDNSHPEYGHFMPVSHDFVNAVTASMPPAGQQSGASLAEYGPDLTADTVSLAGEENLPHINPLLTITPDTAQYGPPVAAPALAAFAPEVSLHWPPPIITKLYQYEQNNDAIYTIFY